MKINILSLCRRTFSTIELPKCDFLPDKYSGPTQKELTKIRTTRLTPALQTIFRTPITFHQGYKQWLFDINGKRYLDLFGGICTVSVGHSHPKITKALGEQIRKLTHVSNIYYHPKIYEYAERLTDKLPGDLKVVYFVNSGSEANDLASLMARIYTNNTEIITLKNCYHGMTYQTMGLTSVASFKYAVPQPSGIQNVMTPDVYRGIWGGTKCRDSPVQTSRQCSCNSKCQAADKYFEQLQNLVKYNIREGTIAAFFAESIQGVAGVVQFPKNYLKMAYDFVKQNNGLFVSDEVQTGFGRTGEHFWGFEMHGIQPDIVTMAKGIGNGFPLAAVVTTPEIAAALTKSQHFNTFGGNPLACTVGTTVLDIIEEEQLQKNSLNVGTHLLKKLETLKEKHSIIGDVRGKGLMIGVELVENDEFSSPLSNEKFSDILDAFREHGVIIGRGGIGGNVFRIKPPMCITKEDVDFTIEVFEKILQEVN